MVLAVISLIIILSIAFLLFIPIDVFIDTRSSQFYVELKGLARASIEPDELEIIRIRLKVPFKVFYFFPLKARSTPEKEKKRRTEKGRKSRNRFTPKTIVKLIRSFTIRAWNLELDTGDCITNAKLYPLLSFMNYRFGGFHINFEGRNSVYLLLRNRPINVLKSFINS